MDLLLPNATVPRVTNSRLCSLTATESRTELDLAVGCDLPGFAKVGAQRFRAFGAALSNALPASSRRSVLTSPRTTSAWAWTTAASGDAAASGDSSCSCGSLGTLTGTAAPLCTESRVPGRLRRRYIVVGIVEVLGTIRCRARRRTTDFHVGRLRQDVHPRSSLVGMPQIKASTAKCRSCPTDPSAPI